MILNDTTLNINNKVLIPNHIALISKKNADNYIINVLKKNRIAVNEKEKVFIVNKKFLHLNNNVLIPDNIAHNPNHIILIPDHFATTSSLQGSLQAKPGVI